MPLTPQPAFRVSPAIVPKSERCARKWRSHRRAKPGNVRPDGSRLERYDQLDDRSETSEEQVLAWRRASVAGMKAAFVYDQLDDAGKTSYDIWAQELERGERMRPFRSHGYIFSIGGPHVGLPQFLINFHRVDDARDMDAYVSRLAKLGGAIDQSLERARASAAKGIRMPRFSYEQALAETRSVVSGAPFGRGKASALWEDAQAKIDALTRSGKITPDQANARRAAASAALTTSVGPAYARLASWLENDMANASKEPQGVSSLPDGTAYYDAMLELQTTTTMTSDQIHELGLSEVARIRGELGAVKQKVGFAGTLPEFFEHMRRERRYFLPNTDAGRREYLTRAEAILATMQARLPEYFGLLPKAPLVVKRVEAFREEPSGAQHYFAGTPDGSRPGIFYAHLSDMSTMPLYQLEEVAYHEGVPGHHLQVSIAQELTGLPRFRTQYGYGAYAEGWGLYAEVLAREMGYYTDPYSDAGRLGGEMWRAIRLVVDTGLHAKGWTEQPAVEYFLANSPMAEGAVRSEVRRYLVWPGQATTYKIGMMTILRMRDEARRELGSRFDYRGFHDVVLGGGSLPLRVLEARVRRWVATQRNAGAQTPNPGTPR